MTALQRKAREIADAVLYEGYLLYPYTASALKNRMRWQFGVVMPQGYADPTEPSQLETQLLCEAHDGATLTVTFRFLQLADPPIEREFSVDIHSANVIVSLSNGNTTLQGTLACELIPDGNYVRAVMRVENQTHVSPSRNRNEALRGAFIGAHIVAEIKSGAFLSLLDPPEEARDAASRCKNRRIFPVLIGDADEDAQRSSLVLASPIILYDFPSVAAQSTGHTFDGTEIDELLLLSVASMTDDEKREARETDARARAIVDRAEALTAEVQLGLHGTCRVGDRVRIHPKRRADAFDIFAAGKTARVKGVHEDVDGRKYVSVIFDDDPASDLHDWYGRSFFYDPDEVQPLGDAQ